MIPIPGSPRRQGKAFSLVELLVAFAILIFILVVIASLTGSVSRVWTQSSAKVEAFQSARLAFDTMRQSLGQCTLHTYFDYYDSGRHRRTASNASSFVPDVYGRCSDLQFVCGKSLVSFPRPQRTHAVFFPSPLGYTRQSSAYGHLDTLLNAVGFYIEFYNDAGERPSFLPSPARWRYRLIEMLQPTENFSAFDPVNAGWFTSPIQTAPPMTHVLAENIVACVVSPRLPSDTAASTVAPAYEYDSLAGWTGGSQPPAMNRPPPIVRLALVAVDEATMERVQGFGTSEPDLGFSYDSLFQDSARMEADLAAVESGLAARRFKFRTFRADVAIPSADWSTN